VSVLATVLNCFSVTCAAAAGRTVPDVPLSLTILAGYVLIFVVARRSIAAKVESRAFFALFRLGLPTLVCLALSMKVIPVEIVSDGVYLQTIRIAFGLSLVGTWVIAAQSCASAGQRGGIVGACLVGTCAVAGLLGLALAVAGQTVRMTVLGLVTALFCLYTCMALGKVLIDYHRPVDIDDPAEPDAGRVDGRPDIDGRCDALAERFALSRRERDVLGELARGHSSGHIATTYCISPNTARTHMRNIYKKLNVSSREELAALVWDGAEVC
jgi:DNA-binding CsgD family transcriptional regulator